MDDKTLLRFLNKIDKDDTTGCWNWQDKPSSSGYGKFNLSGVWVSAHKLSYEHFIEDVPEGLVVRHRCPCGDNKLCVNPLHLKLGTQAENLRDRNDIRRCKLTESDVAKIRHLSETMTHQAIADIYGVSRRQIGNVINNVHWK